MNKPLMHAFGFKPMLDRREKGMCPFCSHPIVASEFRDTLSFTEFTISGLCQTCQDATFGEEMEG